MYANVYAHGFIMLIAHEADKLLIDQHVGTVYRTRVISSCVRDLFHHKVSAKDALIHPSTWMPRKSPQF